MDSADFEHSSVAIANAARIRLSTACRNRCWRPCAGWALAVDDADGVAFAGSDLVADCLAGQPSLRAAAFSGRQPSGASGLNFARISWSCIEDTHEPPLGLIDHEAEFVKRLSF
jgi:hypothetical protein